MAPSLEKKVSTEEKAGILPSHGIELDIPSTGDRPPNIRHMYGRDI